MARKTNWKSGFIKKVFSEPVGIADPISFLILSAVESPINKLNFFFIKLTIAESIASPAILKE